MRKSKKAQRERNRQYWAQHYAQNYRTAAPHINHVFPSPEDPADREPPALGSQVSFDLAAVIGGEGDIDGALHREVTGTVVQVSRPGRWYRVRYPLGTRGDTGHCCFKF